MKKIKSLVNLISKHQFFSDSLIMVIGSNIFNFAQLLYHFMSAKLLGSNTALYGDLASIISILGLIGIIQLAVNLTIIKYVASEKNEEKLSGFIKWVYNKSILIGAIVAGLIILAAPVITKFLNISRPEPVFLLGIIVLFFVVLTTIRSVLQGLVRFDKYIYTLLSEAAVKILFTFLFLLLGYSLLGAVSGFLIGVVIAFFVARYFILEFIQTKKETKPDIRSFFHYSFAAFLQGVSLTSLYSMDLLLVKHFFSPQNAGIYASLTVLGRIVFFGTTPVISVMFPLVAKKYLNGEKYYNILILSSVAILGFSLLVVIFYYFFPTLPITFLYGKEFLGGASILWLFGIFMALLSLATLFTQFYLSIGKTRAVYFFVIAALAQVILIWFIHPSLMGVIQLSILVSALLVFSLLVYSVYQRVHSS